MEIVELGEAAVVVDGDAAAAAAVAATRRLNTGSADRPMARVAVFVREADSAEADAALDEFGRELFGVER